MIQLKSSQMFVKPFHPLLSQKYASWPSARTQEYRGERCADNVARKGASLPQSAYSGIIESNIALSGQTLTDRESPKCSTHRLVEDVLSK